MSAQIKLEHKEHYDILENTQKDTMDVTAWMLWFLDCLGRAIDGAQVTLKAVLDKARFWDRIKDVPLSDRQRSVINRLLDGFEGKLTSSKIREADEVLAGHSSSRHSRPRRARRAHAKPRRRTQHAFRK
jgi:Fic family protein